MKTTSEWNSNSGRNHQNSTDLKRIEYFLALLAHPQDHEGDNPGFQKALLTADILLKSLGIQDRDHKPSIQNILRELRTHFLAISSLATSEVALSAPLPLLSPSSSPLDYSIHVGNALIEGMVRREILKASMETAVAEVKSKNGEIRKVKEEAEILLQTEIKEAQRKAELLLPESSETMAYTSEFYKTKLADLKASQCEKGDSTPEKMTKIDELLKKFAALKEENRVLNRKLNEVSENGALPPSIPQVQIIVAEKRNVLEALSHQINNFDETGNGSVFSS